MPTLEQIQAKLKKLQAQADALIARKAQVAIDQIRELMLKHGLTTADIEAQAKARRAAKGLNGHAGNAKAAAAGQKIPKYRDHKTGATWTGHGRAPGWIATAKDRSVFLIDGASESKWGSVAANNAKAKGQPKGAQPPKYRNPSTGATWSGRGPAPAWLASVKDRSRFLIDGGAASVAGKAGKVKSAAAKKVVAKKARAGSQSIGAKKAAVKPAAKKTAARKVTAKKAATKVASKTASKLPGRKKAASSQPAVTAAAPVASTAASA
ncbi:H-NS family nucleoid-associated regulatory protein [Paraburkholderia graminis]